MSNLGPRISSEEDVLRWLDSSEQQSTRERLECLTEGSLFDEVDSEEAEEEDDIEPVY